MHMARSDSAAGDDSTTGQAPPPRAAEVDWRSALSCALTVALIGAALFAVASYVPALTLVSLLWILGAASIATGIYARRHPSLRMDASVGARIGLSVGVLMTSALAVALAVVGLIARFGLHSMAAFDAQMTHQMHEQVERAIATNPAPASLVQQMLSQEFRTGVMLTGLLIFAVLITVLSTIGGLLSGVIAVGRRRTA
ncbi:MAG: hypothetical protein NVSMB3_01440 [Acidobacteriaceae bacterium]